MQIAAEKTCKFMGNKIPEKIVKPKLVIDENLRNVEKRIIPRYKTSKLLNDSTVSKFVIKNRSQ